MTKIRPAALFAALLLAIAALAVAGCGGGSSSTSKTSEESSESSGGGAEKEGGEEAEGGGEKLTVGSDIPYPPFEQKASGGGYTGFDVELMEAIGKEIGREPEFIDSSFETIFRDVGQGKFEAVMSAATITPEREKEVAFSLPYYLSEQAILVQEGSDIKGLADLKGKVVAAQQGTTGLELAKEKAEASELRPFPEGPDADNALKAGTVEAVIIDAPVAKQQAEELGGIEIVEKVPTEETYGIALAKESTELVEQINEGLKKTIEDGSYATVYEKWFKEAPPLEGLEKAIEEAEAK
ncbi:MAG TPA: basic amino acid ABC transporter substrate-binding protein [Solirubrobacterales bacterium]|nr:basic amino acid ABC transporter substrate-binding protein [Solirubrobacterales bacterium]